MPVVAIFTFIYAELGRVVVILSHERSNFGFFFRCIANLLVFTNPAFLRNTIVKNLVFHRSNYNIYYEKARKMLVLHEKLCYNKT